MENQIILNLQNKEDIEKGIKALLGENYTPFITFLSKYLFDESEKYDTPFNLSYLENNIDINWESIDIKNLWLVNYHFTTRNNKEVIIDNPIHHLRYLVNEETSLKTFLKKHNIAFDVENQLMRVEDRTYNILDHGDDNNTPLFWIDTKLNTDPEVWAFARVLDIGEYNNDFPDYPEFIRNVADVLEDDTDFLDDWKSTYGKPYVIEFKEHLSKIKIYDDHPSSCDEDTMKKRLINILLTLLLSSLRSCSFVIFEDIFGENDILKIATALNRLNDYNNDDSHDVLITSLLKGNDLEPENIIKIWDYEEFQKRSPFE